MRYLDDPPLRWHDRVRRHVTALACAPVRYVRTLVLCLGRPGLAAGYGDCSTLRCFSHAVQVREAVERMRCVGDHPVHVHAHFAHDPALVGMLTARLTGLPFSFTAHARDLLQIPVTSLAARAAEATTVVTCCTANADYISATVPTQDRPPVLVIHHGVELDRFRPTARDPDVAVPTLLSVGRLVEKKGFADLLVALSRVVSAGTAFRCVIYGDGPLRDELVELRDSLGLQRHVELAGARSSAHIVTALGGADVFVLTPRVGADGDRDGIPNVLVEAMACGLPVVTTTAGGIPELVEHGVNGLLAAPGDVAAIADSVIRLLGERALGIRLGAGARRTVEREYDVDVTAGALEDVLHPRRRCDVELTR